MKKSLKQAIWLSAATTMLCVSGVFASCSTKEEATVVEVPTLTSATYTGEKQTASVAENEAYTVSVNDGGTDVGNYNVVLTLTDTAKYKWETPDEDNAANKTLTFQIVQATNEIISLTMEGWTYGEAASTPTGEAKFGTIVYTYASSVDGTYTAEVPSEVGEYYVKASVEGTTNYTAAEKTAAFTIGKQKAEYTAPTANALTYTGAAQALVNAGTATGGTMQYKLGADGTYSETIPTATNAGEYTVYYKVVGDSNHSDTEEASLSVTIAKAENAVQGFTTEGVTGVCGGAFPTFDATATDGTIVYLFSSDNETFAAAADIEGGLSAKTSATWYVKATIAETDNYKAYTSEALSFSVAHDYSVLDTTDEIYDTLKCGCGTAQTGENAYKFKKTLSDSVKTPSVVLSDVLNFALSLDGVSAYSSVESVKLGKTEFGTTLTAVTFEDDFLEDTQNHGAQTLIVTVKDTYGTHEIKVPVLFITSNITSSGDFRNIQCTKSHTTVYGYYVLTADINITSLVDNSDGETTSTFDASQGFRGTLDGNGKTITTKSSIYFGMFGEIGNGAKIFNLKINDAWCKGNKGNSGLLAKAIFGATFENITITITNGNKEVTTADYLAFGEVGASSFKNITINAGGYTFYSLFGDAFWGASGNNPQEKANTFENVVLNEAGLTRIGSNKKIAPDGTLRTQLSDFDTNNCKVWTLTSTDLTGITLYATASVAADNAVKAGASASIVVSAYAGAKIVSLTQNNAAVDYTAGDNTSALTLNLANTFTESDVGTKAYVAELITAEGYHLTLTITLTIESAKETTEVTLSARQEVILASTSGSAAAAIDLGNYATGYNVLSIKYGTYDLGTNATSLTISDTLKADTQNHGNQNIIVNLENASDTNKLVKLTAPVTLVTKSISTMADLQSTLKITASSTSSVYGYYILANDVSYTESGFTVVQAKGGWSSDFAFAGVLNGKGHTITTKSNETTYGLFGTINGATIQNVTIADAWCGSGGYTPIIARNAYNMTIEDVKITVAGNNAPSEAKVDHTILIGNTMQKSTWKNVTITVSPALQLVFGSISDNTFENVSITAPTIAGFAVGVTDAPSGVTITQTAA